MGKISLSWTHTDISTDTQKNNQKGKAGDVLSYCQQIPFKGTDKSVVLQNSDTVRGYVCAVETNRVTKRFFGI